MHTDKIVGMESTAQSSESETAGIIVYTAHSIREQLPKKKDFTEYALFESIQTIYALSCTNNHYYKIISSSSFITTVMREIRKKEIIYIKKLCSLFKTSGAKRISISNNPGTLRLLFQQTDCTVTTDPYFIPDNWYSSCPRAARPLLLAFEEGNHTILKELIDKDPFFKPDFYELANNPWQKTGMVPGLEILCNHYKYTLTLPYFIYMLNKCFNEKIDDWTAIIKLMRKYAAPEVQKLDSCQIFEVLYKNHKNSDTQQLTSTGLEMQKFFNKNFMLLFNNTPIPQSWLDTV